MKIPSSFLKRCSSRTARALFALVAVATVVASFLPWQANAAASDLDPFFDGDGKVTTLLGNGGDDTAGGVAVQKDGKIIVAGSGQGDFALVRYNPDSSLDQTFGNGGKVTTDFGMPDYATDMVIQSDGKIVVIGILDNGSTLQDFALARYNADGSLDASFDFDGKVTTDFTGKGDYAYGVALQTDGKIVVAGYTLNGSHRDFALVRYNADGSLDASFDFDGKVTTDFAGKQDVAYAVAIQADGKIVAAGSAEIIVFTDFALARYSSDGSIDTSFDFDGKQTTDFSSFGSSEEASAVVIQSNSKIVAVGSADHGANFALARYNADGSLDASFDFDGKVTTDFSNSQDGAVGAAIQADGKIIAVGYTSNGSDGDFALARYNPDGSLDTWFDFDGKVTTDFASIVNSATSVALQADGTIIAAGRVEQAGSNVDFALARYHVDGSLDETFDMDGKVTTDISPQSSEAIAVAIQTDGKIIAVGNGYHSGSSYDFALVRYLADGSLDTTFGIGGKVATDFFGKEDYGNGIVIQPDGKIVVSGYSDNGSHNDFALARYNPDGSLDTSFDADGKVTTDFAGNQDMSYGVALQTDGKIMLVGRAHNVSSTDFALARYNTNGSLDTSFDTDGKQTTHFMIGTDIAIGVAVQADGKIVAAGYANGGSGGGNFNFALARYNADGSLDTSFDADGRQTTDFNGKDDFGLGVGLQADGKIVVVGQARNSDNYDFGLARYNGDGSPDSTFDSDGKVITDFFGHSKDFGFNDYANNVVIQADGKIIAVGFAVKPQIANEFAPGDSDFALARYNADGSLDNSFDSDGKVTTDFFNNQFDYGFAVAKQTDGKLVVVGSTYAGGDTFRFALARYGTSDNTPPNLTAVPVSQAKNTTATQTIAHISDAEDMSMALSVRVNGGTSAIVNGVTISNITIDASGVVKTVVQTSCSATSATFMLTVTDTGLLTDSETLTVTITPDTQPPTITCPANVTAVTPANCSSPGSTTVAYPLPAFSDNCPAATVACVPPSGSNFPRGTTTVTCTVTDTSGNTASCSFAVAIFDVCVQDDSNPNNLLLWNSQTGDYRFCGNGTTYTGKGTVLLKGCTITLDHNANGRKVKGQTDKSFYRASGSLQIMPGQLYSLTDRNIRDNSCQCQ